MSQLGLRHKPREIARRMPIPVYEGDDQVLTFAEWCELNSIAPRTGRRILAGPKAERPAVTMLTSRRIGITRRANRLWQERRAR